MLYRSELARIGYDVSSIANSEEIIRVYFNIYRRLISLEPRQVFKSKNFSHAPEFNDILKRIERLIESGGNINPYLSKKICDLNYNDLLLNDWGIHHLHLGRKVEPDGFAERTSPLLYCLFEKEIAYFIDVLSHEDFTSKKLIKTIHHNWPDLLSRYQLNGFKGNRYSDEEIKALRKANMNCYIEIEDGISYYAPGGGMTSAGSSIHAQLESSRHVSWVRSAQQWIIDNIELVVTDALKKSAILPNPAQFNLQVINEKAYAVEVDSKIAISLESLS